MRRSDIFWPLLLFRSAGFFFAIFVVTLFTSLFASSFAYADEALAREHFKKGIALYDKKQYTEALASFQEAYKEKPSAGIKQNIALCLKGLGKPAEAATSFDEALDEGKGTLKPETKAAMERELAELSKVVATVNISAVIEVAVGDRRPVDGATITIEPAGEKPRPLAPGAHHRPIRLMPGIYTFRANAPGYPDPPEKKFALVSGTPVDAAFIFGTQAGAGAPPPPGQGTLSIEPSVQDAVIRVDGVEVGKGKWRGNVPAGPHKVEAAAPGWKTTTIDVTVSAGAAVDYPVRLLAIGEAPPEYVAPAMKPPKKRTFYLAITGAIDGASYRLSPALGETNQADARRGFLGLSIGGRAGVHVHHMVALELSAEAGGMPAKYTKTGDPGASTTTVAHWALMPGIRAMGPGKVRFTMGTGFGLSGIAVETKFPAPGAGAAAPPSKKGTGVAFAWVIDAGMQAELGPVFIEGALFMNVHGIGPVRVDDAAGDRMLEHSPGVRPGLRLGLGIPF